MEIITGTDIELKNMIQETSLQYFRAVDRLEKCALYYRLDSLCGVLNSVSQEKKNVRLSHKIKKDAEQYADALNSYYDIFVCKFIEDKDFHNAYLGNILDVQNEELAVLAGLEDSSTNSKLSKNDFYMILFDYLKTINMEHTFDDLIKGRKIFSKIRPYRPYSLNFNGMVLHNPIDGDMSIVVDDFQYQLVDMAVLAHELGHIYDLSNLGKEELCKNVTSYAYSSILGETISTIFEKRFYEYLIKNNIMVEKAKDLYNNSLFDGKDHVFVGYILSLLSNKYLIDGQYASLDKKKLFDLVSENFEDNVSLRAILEYKSFSLHSDLLYGYGDVLSTFLKKEVDNEGFDGKLMHDLMGCRTKPFDPGFIESHDLDVKTYKKLYKQDVELCKK